MTERRKNNRVNRNIKLKVKEYIHGKTRKYHTADISSSGLFIKTRKPLHIGETVLLHYPLPGSREEVRVEGEVVRIVDKNAVRSNPRLERGFGISFLRAIDPQGALG